MECYNYGKKDVSRYYLNNALYCAGRKRKQYKYIVHRVEQSTERWKI